MLNTNVSGLIRGTEIEQIIRQRINQREPMSILFTRLFHLTAYQKEYGWLKTDAVLQLLKQVVTDALKHSAGADSFAAYLLNDEFIIVCAPQNAEALAQASIAQFDRVIPSHYSVQAQQRGCVLDVVDRRGNPVRSPIVSVGIAIISSEQRALEHPIQIKQLADQVLDYIENSQSSRYIVDRRQGDGRRKNTDRRQELTSGYADDRRQMDDRRGGDDRRRN